MAVSPISDLVFHIKRSVLDDVCPTLVGIDRGCSLTKAMFVTKTGEGDTATHYAVHCVLFQNKDFLDCLHFLKEHAKLPSSGDLHVTGAGCDQYREKIEEIFGLKVHFITEFLAMIHGTHFMMQNVEDRSELLYPDVLPSRSYDIKLSPEFQAVKTAMIKTASANNGPDPNALTPCILVLLGSSTGFLILKPDGTFDVKGGSMVGGKTLIGLGKLMADAKDYDHLMELAEAGDPGKIDTTISEILKNDPESPYGQYPRDMPVFPLGKLVDHDMSVQEVSQQDRAASALRFMATNLMLSVRCITTSEGINRVVFAGNGARGVAFRRSIMAVLKEGMDLDFNIKFLRTGGTGALGAMISEPSRKK